MSIFDVDQQGAQRIADQAQADLVPYDNVQPGFFDDFGSAIGQGIMRGGAKLGRSAALAAAGLSILQTGDTEVSDDIFGFIDDTINPAIDFWTPDARDVGTAGRVLGNLAEIALPLVAGGGNPTPLIGSTGLNTAIDLTREGVDPATSIGVGLVDATAVGVGFRLPFLGNTFLKKAATGAGGSVALGVTATVADRAVLESRGYDEIAERYDPLDVEARTVDLLTGIAFGGIAQLQSRARATASRDSRDAALAGLNAHHFEIESAPGRPADQSALIRHQSALEQAIRDLNADEVVNVGQSRVTDSTFRDPPSRPAELSDDARAVLEELGIRDQPVDVAAPREASVTAGRDPVLSAADEALPRDIDTPVERVADPVADAPPASPRPAATSDAAPARTAEPARGSDPPAAAEDIDVQAAQRAVETSDIEIPTGERDADDNQVLTSGREALEQSKQEVQRANVEAKGYEAAVACLLSFGE